MKLAFVFAALVGMGVAFVPHGGAMAADAKPPSSSVDYSKPLFTKAGIPLCQSRDDLQALLSLLRNGQKELAGKVRGCMSFPLDGVPVIVLDAEGVFDVWVRARIMLNDGSQPTIWTVGWMLRNDDSLPITGDPANGKVKVCMTGEFGDVHVPSLAMFKNGGNLIGNQTDKWKSENFKSDTVNSHASLVTTEAIDLTNDKPCAEASARMFTRDNQFTVKTWPSSPRTVWDFEQVLGYPLTKLAQPGKLGLLRGQIGLRAVIIADLGNPLSVSDEDAAKNEPDNPLNRIPEDMKLARAAAPNGPKGKGNFQVCLWKDIDDVADDEAQSVSVPPGVIFQSSGRLIGDIRDPEPDVQYGLYDNKTTFSVVNQKPFILSKKKPCFVTSVRSVISERNSWIFPFVRVADRLRFQATGLMGHSDNEGLPGHLGDALDVGALNGTPTADIGDPLELEEKP